MQRRLDMSLEASATRLEDLEAKLQSLESALSIMQGAQQQVWLTLLPQEPVSVPGENIDGVQITDHTNLGIRLADQAGILAQSFENIQLSLTEKKSNTFQVLSDMRGEIAALEQGLRAVRNDLRTRSLQDEDLRVMNDTVLKSVNSVVDIMRGVLLPLVTYLNSTSELPHRDFMKRLMSTTTFLHDSTQKISQGMELSLFRGRELKLPTGVVYDLSPTTASSSTNGSVAASGRSTGWQGVARVQQVTIHPYLGPCLRERAAFMHIERGEWAQLALLLEQSPNLVLTACHYGPGRNFTLLHCAVYVGNTDIAIMLMNLGAKVNAKTPFERLTSLHIANEKGDAKMLGVLLNHGAEYYENIKSLQVELKHYDSAECIEWRKKYAAAARKFLSYETFKEYDLNIVDVFGVSYLGQITPLGMPNRLPVPAYSTAASIHPDAIVAAELAAEYAISGRRKALVYILRTYPGFINGLRASILGYTLLMLACDNGHDNLARYLIDNMHADVNALSQPHSCASRDERVSALYIAAKRNHIRVVKVLLRRGADWMRPLVQPRSIYDLICCIPPTEYSFEDDMALSASVKEVIHLKTTLYQTPDAAMRAYMTLVDEKTTREALPNALGGTYSAVLSLSDEEDDEVSTPVIFCVDR